MPPEEASTSNNTAAPSVQAFFDTASSHYDESIRKAIPPYQEIFQALIDYAFWEQNAPLKILELGCGTGNLSVFLGTCFPHAELTLVDLSAEMLQQAKGKLTTLTQPPKIIEGGFLEVELPLQHYDWVISSVALHHLNDTEKPIIYRRIYNWLKPGGLFRCADEVKSLPADRAMALNEEQWSAWAKREGATDEDIAFWVEHAKLYDHYASLHDHFNWLTSTGFTEVDCYWKKLFWAVFGARKSQG